MGFEVDFLAVGEGERSGDAIALRFGNLYGPREEQVIVVIDGGTKETGEDLVTHIKAYYNTDWVNVVLSTHPDADHASGLTVVLEQLGVSCLLMHKPWEHAEDVSKMFFKGHLVEGARLQEKLRKALQSARDLETVATERHISIVEPFAGLHGYNSQLRILGPSKAYYQSLLPGFRCAPNLLQKAAAAVERFFKAITESPDFSTETLDDTGETSAENNSSVIFLLSIDGQNLLFTGDAGIPALTTAADYAASLGIDLAQLNFFQVPHHGSRRNVGPTILNRIKSPTAFISVAKDGTPKHPSQRVVNALIRRGSSVYATQGTPLLHHYNAPNRNWPAARPLSFSTQVEEVED